MEIKDDSLYSINETSEATKIPKRTLQRKARTMGAKMIDGRYLFSGHQIKKLILSNAPTPRQTSINAPTKSDDLKPLSRDSSPNTININIDVLNVLKTRIKELEKENAELRDELTREIPRQEKLRNAIELITLEALEQNVQHKIFTDEEYNDIIGTINEVEFQKEQVQYLRSRVEKQDTILAKLVNQVSERNYIEAKEKGFDKK